MIPSKRIILHADPEHAGIRQVVLVGLLFCLAFGYWLTRRLFLLFVGEEWGVVTYCLGALLIGLLMAWLLEFLLKRFWKSGQVIELDSAGIYLTTNGLEQTTLSFSDNIHALKWFFNMDGYPRAGRERRISNKWSCYACQIVQNQQRLTLFAFLSPAIAQQLGDDHDFFQIHPAEAYDVDENSRRFRASNRPKLSTRLLTGKSGRYWNAEKQRWQEGIELTDKDFLTLLQYLPDS